MEKDIDILKIDTEGVEVKTVTSLHTELAEKIRIIYLEAYPEHSLHLAIFRQKQYGSVCQLRNQKKYRFKTKKVRM